MSFVITESEGVWIDEVLTPDDHRFVITRIGPPGIHPSEVDNGNALWKPVTENSGKACRLIFRWCVSCGMISRRPIFL